MLLVRHVPYYYLRSFPKIASHGSYDEMLLTTNKGGVILLPCPLPRETMRCQCRAIVALVARCRAGVIARIVIFVIVVACPVSSTSSSVAIVVLVAVVVVNIVIHRNHRRCCHCCCRPSCCRHQSRRHCRCRRCRPSRHRRHRHHRSRRPSRCRNCCCRCRINGNENAEFPSSSRSIVISSSM